MIKTNKFRSFKSINFSQFLLKIKFSSKENMSKKQIQVVFEFKFNFEFKFINFFPNKIINMNI